MTRNLRNFLRTPALMGITLLIFGFIANAIVQPTLLKASVLTSDLGVMAPLAVVAIGQTIVILAGGIDLSVGSVVTLVNVLTVSLYTYQHMNFGLAAFLGILAGVFVGVMNGFVVSVVKVPPLLGTFGMMSVAGGASLLIMSQPGGGIPMNVSDTYSQQWLGIPVPLLLMIITLLLWALVKYRKLGRHLLAVGGNSWASLASGISVGKVQFFSYVLASLFAGLGGLLLTAEVTSADPLIGSPYVLNSVAAVVLGGTALSGGKGSVIGSVAGALFLGLIDNIVFFANVPSFYQQFVSGLIVMAGLTITGVLYSRAGLLRWFAGRKQA